MTEKALTTLELAEAIAAAVNKCHPEEGAQAVFRVLRDHACWFCRCQLHPEDGAIVSAKQMPLEF